MRFAVASLDALRTNYDWEVNDQTQIGSIDISEDVANDDQLVLDVLNANNITNNLTTEDVYFMGEDLHYIQIHDEETDRPLFALILEQ